MLIAGGMAIYGLLLALFGVTGWRRGGRRDPAKHGLRLARLGPAWQYDGAKRRHAREADNGIR